MGQFVNPETYINTGYTNIVLYEEENGEIIHTDTLETNELNTLCFSKKRTDMRLQDEVRDQISGQLYRTYTELDLHELKHINKALVTQKAIPTIDLTTIMSTFDGHSLFSIYYDDVRVLE